MKGACAPSESLIWKTAPITLPQGKYYIERDAWGWARFNKIEEQPRVLVTLKQDEDDEEMREDDQSEGDEDTNVSFTNAFRESVTFPVGIDLLPIEPQLKIDRKPGEFIPIGPDGDAIPAEYETIDSDDEFVLKAPDKARMQKPEQASDVEHIWTDDDFYETDDTTIKSPDTKDDPLKDLYGDDT